MSKKRHDAEELQRRAGRWRGEGLTETWAEALAVLDMMAEAEIEPGGAEAAGEDAEIAFVAFQDKGDARGMTPVSDDGHHLVTFPTSEAARKAAGALGVAAPQTRLGLRITCQAHGLRLPRGNGGSET